MIKVHTMHRIDVFLRESSRPSWWVLTVLATADVIHTGKSRHTGNWKLNKNIYIVSKRAQKTQSMLTFLIPYFGRFTIQFFHAQQFNVIYKWLNTK